MCIFYILGLLPLHYTSTNGAHPNFLELRFSLIELSYHVSYIYGSLVDVRAVVQIGTT